MNTVFGGWQVAGLTTITTGNHFTITNSSYGPGGGYNIGTNSYARLIGDPNAPPLVSNVPGVLGPLLFNSAAFALPTGLTYGDSGRNILRYPRKTNFDFALFKLFPVAEGKAFKLRAEAFNVGNHTQWTAISGSDGCYGGPNFSTGDANCLSRSTFLHPTAARSPRIIELGLKFAF